MVEIAFGTKEKGRCSLNLLRKLVGYRNGLYWGLVYVGRKPSKTTIEQVLFEAGLEVEHEDTEIHW